MPGKSLVSIGKSFLFLGGGVLLAGVFIEECFYWRVGLQSKQDVQLLFSKNRSHIKVKTIENNTAGPRSPWTSAAGGGKLSCPLS